LTQYSLVNLALMWGILWPERVWSGYIAESYWYRDWYHGGI